MQLDFMPVVFFDGNWDARFLSIWLLCMKSFLKVPAEAIRRRKRIPVLVWDHVQRSAHAVADLMTKKPHLKIVFCPLCSLFATVPSDMTHFATYTKDESKQSKIRIIISDDFNALLIGRGQRK